MRKLTMVVVIVALASLHKPAMAQEATSSGWSGAEIAALVIVGAAAAAVAWFAFGNAVVAGELLAAESGAEMAGGMMAGEAAAAEGAAAGAEIAGGMRMAGNGGMMGIGGGRGLQMAMR